MVLFHSQTRRHMIKIILIALMQDKDQKEKKHNNILHWHNNSLIVSVYPLFYPGSSYLKNKSKKIKDVSRAHAFCLVCFLWFFTSQSTAMVMLGWSVHLTTLFLGTRNIFFVINLCQNMGKGWEQTRNPFICSWHISTVRHVTD